MAWRSCAASHAGGHRRPGQVSCGNGRKDRDKSVPSRPHGNRAAGSRGTRRVSRPCSRDVAMIPGPGAGLGYDSGAPRMRQSAVDLRDPGCVGYRCFRNRHTHMSRKQGTHLDEMESPGKGCSHSHNKTEKTERKGQHQSGSKQRNHGITPKNSKSLSFNRFTNNQQPRF